MVGNHAAQGNTPPAVSLRVETLKTRQDFLRAARARHTATKGFVLQMRTRARAEIADPDIIRVGFTCSKKVGNAVARNRAKRRLREVSRLVLPTHGKAGHDYVLIGRRDSTAMVSFQQLETDLIRALAKLHGAAS